ncbi:MAG: hypothetical protein C0603_07930 [Denitrovibrio sp.]|nr:MAG: hypothetical protein C0603_07930 [Denitrovibrio sp.]
MNKRKNWSLSLLYFALLLSFSASGHSGELTVCYDASFLFKIGESCITYKITDDNAMTVESRQQTTGMIDLLHHLEQKVSAEVSLKPFESKYLFFYEKNEHKTITHHYFFDKQIKYTSNSYRYKNKRYKSKNKLFDRKDVLDPTAAVLFIQLQDLPSVEGKLTSFFEGKYVDITYNQIGQKDISFEGDIFRCSVIDFKVPVSTSSLVTPTGVWRIYIDEQTGVIMRLELKFPLGSARLKPVSISGDRALFKKYISKGL